ncbi:MAG: response regulator [Opitutaceae bacterium]|nr:response regulator [Opitutaceae bacterium]
MNPYTILVVEDQEEMRAAIEAMLTVAGYCVVSAANGHEAKRTIATHAIDLVLTDLLMPGKDGIEVISDLRHGNPQLPIIAMSGGGRMPASFYLNIARGLGAETLLGKPFSEQRLLAEVEKALARQEAE